MTRWRGAPERGRVWPAMFEHHGNGNGGNGGVSGDGQSLFAITGNTFGTTSWFGATEWSGSEAVLRLSPDLARPIETRDYFAPSNWRDLDRRDLDLGGTAAIPLDVAGPNGARKLIFAIGKTGEAYLLDRDNLGGVGGAFASARVSQTSPSPRRPFGAPRTGFLSFCRARARIVREVSRRAV